MTDLDGEPGGLGGCSVLHLLRRHAGRVQQLRLHRRRDRARGPDLLGLDRRRLPDRRRHEHGRHPTSPASPRSSRPPTRRCSRGRRSAPEGDRRVPERRLCRRRRKRRLRRQGPVGERPGRLSASRSSTRCDAAQAAAGWDGKPTIQITSPTDGATVSGIVNFTATADDDHGVTKVDFFVNGALAVDRHATGPMAGRSTWDTAASPAGRILVDGHGDRHGRPDGSDRGHRQVGTTSRATGSATTARTATSSAAGTGRAATWPACRPA